MILTLARVNEIIALCGGEPEAPKGIVTGAAPADVTGRALEIWHAPSENRSKRDAVFVLALRREKVTEARARELLPLLPGGKANEDGRTDDSYWESTIGWVRREFSADEAALKLASTVMRKHVFEKKTIDALARVYALDRDIYEKNLKRLKKKGIRLAAIEKAVAQARAVQSVPEWDAIARHAVAEGESAGWWYKGKAGWVAYSSSDWARNLTGGGAPPAAVSKALSDDPWTLVAEPFQAEELPGRRWNRNVATLRFKPMQGEHPTWDRVLRIIGRGLDGESKLAGLQSGGNYLFLWVASIVQRPHVKLPYLFLYGEQQNAGKSMFHESIARLLTRGYVLANEALENDRGFNGELHGAVVCAADEIQLGRKAYKRIKQWLTGEMILIHPKGKTAYQIKNSTHWVQTGNESSDCPQIAEDTRITAFKVWQAEEKDRTSKDSLFEAMDREGEAFTWSLLNATLPDVKGRMGLPMLVTAQKRAQQKANATPLETWLALHPEHLAWTDDELANRFLESLPGGHNWDRGIVLGKLASGVGADRRLYRGLLDLAQKGDWKGTVSELMETLSPSISGDWPEVSLFGVALSKPWPRLSIQKTRTKTKRLVFVQKIG